MKLFLLFISFTRKQFINEGCENGTKTIDAKPMVILTKHCFVRLDRVTSLDKMIDVGTFYVDPIYAQNDHVIDNNTVSIQFILKIFEAENFITLNIAFHSIVPIETDSETEFEH